MTGTLSQHVLAILLCAAFVIAGCIGISQPGLQADESLFAMGVYYPEGVRWSVRAFGRQIPLMQMAYLGSLKSWIYGALFQLWPPSAASVRVPMVLAGAATLWLVWLLLRSVASARAGLIALALLALDPSLVWTTRCDWGPVALQHLLAVAGVYAFVRRRFELGALLFGLALWDKAVFAWSLAGLAVAAAVVLRDEIRRSFTLRRAALCILAFCLGALPLLAFNWRSHGETARRTAVFEPSRVVTTAAPLMYALDGRALFGYLVRDDFQGVRKTLTPWLLLGAVLALPWLLRTPARRTTLFFLVAAVTAWLSMVTTVGGGESVHHLVLLWPWPHCFLAVAIAQLPRRVAPALAAAALLSCGLVTANYHRMLRNNGADPPWSDAIYRLAEFVSTAPSSRIYVTDWGILEQLRLLSRGEAPLHPDAGIPGRLDDTEALYIAHTDRYQAFEGINAKVEQAATALTPLAFEKRVVAVIRDGKGNPVFQAFRMVPKSSR